MPGFPAPSESGGASAEVLAAFVPPLALARLARAASPLVTAEVEEFEGAVLFTDITGFTPLTERMDASGPDGVERLSTRLNAYFTRLIDVIEAHGGAVGKFAGDAVLAVWRENPARALRCAAALRTVFAPARAAGESELAIKVAVGAGRVAHGFFGGHGGRWLTMLGGPAMEAARGAIRAGLPAHLPESGAAPPARERFHRPPCPSGPALAPHVPPFVRERLAAGHTAWMAEFRRVTVLFVHAPGVRLAGTGDGERVQRVCALVQAEIARCGGALDDTGEDHDGVVVVAAFGLPGCTHEDDAARAVRAARAIQERLRALDPGVSIGVATGRLFCGSIGSEAVRSYSMVGDTMNRGARLMTLARGDIYCDEATREHAAPRIEFEFLRHTTLAGRTAPAAILRPRAHTREAAAAASGMLGRAAEREWIRCRLADLIAAGRGGVAIVEGEAGIGKTTLLGELEAQARAAGLCHARGGGDAIDATTPCHAWQAVFHQVLDLPEAAPAASRAARVLAALPAEDALLAPLLNPLAGSALPESDLTAQMTGKARAEELARVLAGLLHHYASGAPMLVILEDCHWLDSASLALALALTRRLPRLLLALASRPRGEAPPEEWCGLCAAAGADHRTLGPLAPDDVAALAARRLGAEHVDAAVARFVGEGGRGNPFFCEELCHALRDSGQVAIERGQCRLAPGGAGRRLIPHGTVQAVVGARIDRLSEREQLTMKVASVHGRRFSLRMLAQVHPVEADRTHLPACLARLVALDFAVGLEDGESFEFKHAIVQEVAYQQLVFAQRQALHRRVAEWMEREEQADAALLAHHWSEAAVPERALPCLGRAGDEACRRFANREAADFLDRAIALAASSPQPVERATLGRWWRQRAEARFHMGRVGQCLDDLAEAVRLLGWPMPRGWWLRAWHLPLEIARQGLRRALRRRPAPFTGARHAELAEAARAFHLLAEAAFFQHDMPASAYGVFRGANLAERLGTPSALVAPYCGMMLMTGIASRATGEACLRLAGRAAEESATPTARAYAGLVSAIFLGGHGEVPRVRACVEEAVVIFRRYGDGRRVEESLINLIYPLLYHGAYAECAGLVEEMHRSAEQRADTQTLGWVRLMCAQVLLPTQGPQAALEALGTNYATGLDELTATAMQATAAVAWWRLGDAACAQRHARIALAGSEARPPLAHVMLLYTSYVVEVCLGLRATGPAAAAEARRARRQMRRFARIFPVARSRAALWEGVWRWTEGRRTHAAHCWATALAAARRLDLQPDVARAHACLALVEDGTHADNARAIAARLGAVAELDSLSAALHKAGGLQP